MPHPLRSAISNSVTLSALAAILSVSLSVAASVHVVLRKRDPRSAIGWIGLIWLSPFLGALIYLMFGINRITRQARSLRQARPRLLPGPARSDSLELLHEAVTAEGAHIEALARLVGQVTQRPLLGGNQIGPLFGGDQAYPAMIAAIDAATRSVALSSYIFNADRAGRAFIEALKRAQARKVEVRVLIDDVGTRYGWPRITWALRRAGLRYDTFIPSPAPLKLPYWNLRNHRKILVVDGRIGFTGGMNILEDYQQSLHPRRPKNDLHFKLLGPVVGHLQQVFADDWRFAAGELLDGETWFPALESAGPILARGITDGPDEDRDKLVETLLGALSCARSSVLIATPYFVPDLPLISALNVAAMRGVSVDIILPRENNLKLVKWASTSLLDEVLAQGCRVWYAPGPFDHTKLMVVDRVWTLFGSGNWDARSLRLNFEFCVECYSRPFAERVERNYRERCPTLEPVTLDQINGRGLPVKLRDGIVRLFSPYL
jgi:cardiolipin synthase